MSKYVVSVEAKTDLVEIWEYVAHDNLDAADRWIARLREAFDTLARAPGIGHKREDLTDLRILFWPVGAYLVIYRAQMGQSRNRCGAPRDARALAADIVAEPFGL